MNRDEPHRATTPVFETSEAERESIDIGLRASRELEGDNEAYPWAQLLYSLDAYIEDWPTDNEAAAATDDDFFASDED